MFQVPPRPTPLLIYDGDCSFCKYWVERWKRITGSRVSYAPYQEVAHEFPKIPLPAFQESVKFVDQQGRVWSGAEAACRSLATAPQKRWLLWTYKHVPGFALLSELGYQFVARHRGLLYKLMGSPSSCSLRPQR